ncbi:hypothetical protein SISSUDRAFT_1126862 [Sistotremastrum suecicum HHB10207 ss-3]|uniref:F-box domain-containing protein n=1 Tax=Sistotremastrum suecicum HHB10207 ss-3 TaxID=1314776 RepID=A0A166FTE5_9AGAM|nr:hypothetical protein SISSUDRAFT_1126862 [Sistotremastrum suecicum HHB10207 ss-3]
MRANCRHLARCLLVYSRRWSCCPTRALFPLLHEVELRFSQKTSSQQRYSFLFLHENLKSFSIASDAQGLKYILRSIPKMSPRLESIKIICSNSIESTSDDLVALVTELLQLREITISSHLLSTTVLLALAKHPRIATVCQDSKDVTNAKIPGTQYEYRFAATDFQSLNYLRLDTALDDLTRWLYSDDILPSLSRLHVELRDKAPHLMVRDCFSQIARALPRIVGLTFDMYTHNKAPSGAPCDVTFDTFVPLLKRLSLTSFIFDHPDPLALSDLEVGRMAAMWPVLATFSLGSSALYSDPQSHLTMGVLLSFAENCYHLKTLSLNINTSLAPSREPSGESVFGHYFETLNVGCSPIRDAHVASRFLAQILPEKAEITSWDGGADISNTGASKALKSALISRSALWLEARVWIKTLVRARLLQEERIRQTLASLVSRLRVLESENMKLEKELFC